MPHNGRTIIFLGAGASRCCGIPTMKDLTKHLLSSELGKDLRVIKRLFRTCSVPFNVETILGYLTTSANRHGYFRDSGSTHLALARGKKCIDLRSRPRHRTLAQQVKYEIRDRFYLQQEHRRSRNRRKNFPIHTLQVRYDFFLQRLVQNQLFHLSPSLPRGDPRYPNVEFFTTNYDDALETFFEWAGVPTTDGYVESIDPPDKGDQINYRFDELEFDDTDELRIYRLFGSVRYASYKGSISRIDPYTWSHPGRRRTFGDLLIYPGSTKVIWNDPQLQLFYRLHQRLRDPSTSYCIVVGYSFQDRAVADVFKNALYLNPSLRIYLVGLQARTIVRNVFDNHSSVKAIRKKFEKLDPLRDFR